MNVNSFNQGFFKRYGLKFFAAIAVSLCAIFFLAAFVADKSEGEAITKRVNIAVRAIGHDLLLRAGDSTSVVRPVIEKSNGVFLLEFENEFMFQPDTLVEIVQRSLVKTGLSHYTVTIQEFDRSAIVYGFEINPPDNSITPCRGRSQPKACYTIKIAFADFPATTVSYLPIGILLGSIPLVLAFMLISRNSGSTKSSIAQQNALVESESKSLLTIGRFLQ